MTDGPLPAAGSDLGRRVRARLRDESVIWLTTLGADGTPQPNPVWFVWRDPDTILVYNRPDAHRLTHVRTRPRVALHFNTDVGGDDVAVFTGAAQVDDDEPAPDQDAGYLAKYDAAMAGVSGSSEQFAAAYPVPLVVRVDRVRGY